MKITAYLKLHNIFVDVKYINCEDEYIVYCYPDDEYYSEADFEDISLSIENERE